MNSLKRKQVTLRLMPEIYERVERKAKKLGISTNAFITMIIAESVKK